MGRIEAIVMRFHTPFNGYAVKFSPYEWGGSGGRATCRVAVATAQNFGIIGNGRQHVLEMREGQGIEEIGSFETADGLYDCSWSEYHRDVLVSASGDGSIKIWNVSLPPHMNPLRSFHDHKHEVYSVACNFNQNRSLFLSASWDDTIKLWDTEQKMPGSISTYHEHRQGILPLSLF